jgi:DNA sulfur modification protein DndC
VEVLALQNLFTAPNAALTNPEVPGVSLEDSLHRTLTILKDAVIHRGMRDWIVTYSGGKDSTVLTVVAIEVLRRHVDWMPEKITVVYADTLNEIPPVHSNALGFLARIRHLAQRENLPVTTRIAKPEMQQRFWFLMLGKGYPPPHRKFWWCTKRLKIQPVKQTIASLDHQEANTVLTGVRFSESAERTRRLKKHTPCLGQGECGQSLEYNSHSSGHVIGSQEFYTVQKGSKGAIRQPWSYPELPVKA